MKLTIEINETTHPLLTVTLHYPGGSKVIAESQQLSITHSRACIDGPPNGTYSTVVPGERKLTIDASQFKLLDKSLSAIAGTA